MLVEPEEICNDDVSSARIEVLDQAAGAKSAPLKSLTSLRFFAALMILVYHLSMLFLFQSNTVLGKMALWQGVSFFFVLSGFILSYAHPELPSKKSVIQFWIARLARVWPTHIFGMLLAVLLVPQCLQIPEFAPKALANIFMVHDWLYKPDYISCFNKASWTISIELFFYACFPFLIQPRYKKFGIIASFLMLFAFLSFGVLAHVRGQSDGSFLASAFINFNPLARVFEFCLGMWVCQLFRAHAGTSSADTRNRFSATVYEVVVLCFVVAAVFLPVLWPHKYALKGLSVLKESLEFIGGAPVYAALIFLMARGNGWVSKFLEAGFLVLLGEMSFGLYIVHMPIMQALSKYQAGFRNLPAAVLPVIVTAICLLVAYLSLVLIERPCRRLILRLSRPENVTSKISTASAPYRLQNITQISGISILLIVLVCFAINKFRLISSSEVNEIALHSDSDARNINFGGMFQLCGVDKPTIANGRCVTFVWQSLKSQNLDFINVVHLVDAKGVTFANLDYTQDLAHRHVKKGQSWKDQVTLTESQFLRTARVGLLLFRPETYETLTVDVPNSDFGMHRLVVSVNDLKSPSY